MKKPSQEFKYNLFIGFVVLITGLSFALFYQYLLPDKIMSIVSVCLGFATGNFIILMGLIKELYRK